MKIANLRIEIPEMTEWPFRKYSSENRIFYYRPGTFHDTPVYDPLYYSFIDGNLKVLCSVLHKSGLETSPSFYGEFRQKPEFKSLWNHLRQEERIIRRIGLDITDTETGERHVFSDRDFRLPWSSLDELYDYYSKQVTGWIGVLIPNDRTEIIQQIKENPYTTSYSEIKHGITYNRENSSFETFWIRVRGPSASEHAKEWRLVTNFFAKILSPRKEQPIPA